MKTVFHIAIYISFILLVTPLFGQFVTLEGYVYASNNTGYLNEVKITVLDGNKALIGETRSNVEGLFTLDLLPGKDYEVRANKPGFDEKIVMWSSLGKAAGEKGYLKVAMDRAPGYILDVTMAELADPDEVEEIDAIVGATIEIYNNTKKEEALVLKDHQSHTFSFTLEQGNSYTAMIRKKGFYTKRMDLNVAVDGCILCMDGFGEINPGVSENLTAGHVSGTLGANVNLQKIEIGEAIVLNNIYYDYGKADIRSDAAIELDKIVGVLKDNRQLLVEISSHTDSRGQSSKNQALSERRAKAAVDYLVGQGVDRTRLVHKGYGESKLRNKCGNNVECTEKQHQRNRRTEFTVIGFTEKDPYEHYSLKRIIEEDRMMEEIMNLDQTIIQIKEGEEPPSNDNPPENDQPEGILVQDNTALLNDLTGETETVSIDDAPDKEKPELEPEILPGPDVEDITPILDPEIEDEKKVNDSRLIKSVPGNYSGYKIQVLSASRQLSPDHRLFREFGDLQMDQSGPGRFHYLIGNFQSGNEALNFMGKNISPRFPNASVIHYKNGKRVD